jgi:Cdc6-like AAA superfamily ATPase
VKNHDAFSVGHDLAKDMVCVPESRKKQIIQITDIIGKFLTGSQPAIFVQGSVGSGKTTLVKYAASLANSNMEYINCKSIKTTYRLICGGNKKKISSTLAWDNFQKKIKNKKTIMILDEAESLEDNTEFFYTISRDPKYKNMMLIMVSQNVDFMESLDTSTQSSLKSNTIIFTKYNVEDLKYILDKRAEIGFYDKDDGIIGVIASAVTKYAQADARVAIKAMEEVMSDYVHKERTLEEDNKMCEIVKDAVLKNKKDLLMNQFTLLSDKEKKILQLIYENGYSCSIGKIARYSNVLRELQKHPKFSMSASHLSMITDSLASRGFINKSKIRDKQTHIGILQLTEEVDQKILAETYIPEF